MEEEKSRGGVPVLRRESLKPLFTIFSDKLIDDFSPSLPAGKEECRFGRQGTRREYATSPLPQDRFFELNQNKTWGKVLEGHETIMRFHEIYGNRQVGVPE